jgi:putative ABC transport system substrate-binding protein
MRFIDLGRREFVTLFGGAAATWPLAARAQKVGKVPTIGVLWHAGSAEEEAVYLGAVRRGLSDLGYIEGQNIILDNRFPAEIPERFVSLAAELAAQKVDVLVAINRIAALAAQRATTTIPIVFVAIPDPVGSKLVASLAHPGGNITGLTNFAHELTAKRVELLKATVSNVSRVALLVNPNDRDSARTYVEEGQAAATKLGLILVPVEVRTPGELVSAFSKISDEHVNGVVVSQDGLFYATRKNIADLALAHKLPLAVYSRETVEAGALVSYGPSNSAIFRRAGYYVDKILKGTSPADLPVEQPTKFEFIINLKTAKALSLIVPPALLARADEVIE